jgi:MYXO-CTERM domain-containing protein
MDPPSDPGAGGGDVDVPPTDSTGETTGVTTGVDVTESPGADTGGGTPPQPGNTGGQQTPSGTETAAPVEGAVSGAPAGSGTPSGTATTTPQAGVPGAPLAADTAPAATESQGGSDGGCHMSGDAASSRWAWVALLLGVCASWVRRRRARA